MNNDHTNTFNPFATLRAESIGGSRPARLHIVPGSRLVITRDAKYVNGELVALAQGTIIPPRGSAVTDTHADIQTSPALTAPVAKR